MFYSSSKLLLIALLKFVVPEISQFETENQESCIFYIVPVPWLTNWFVKYYSNLILFYINVCGIGKQHIKRCKLKYFKK